MRVSILLALLALSAPARAGGATLKEAAGADALGKGTLEGLALDDTGVVRPGPAFDAIPLDVPTAWAAATVGEDLWVATGNEALLLRVGKDGKVERLSTGDGLMATAVAPLPGGAVAAAVFPGGRIVKASRDAAGVHQVETLAKVPAEYVWAMVADERGGLTVVTGVPGAVFRVDPFGAVEKVAEVGDDHARCLARRGEAWLVGTSPKGRLLEVKGGRVAVLRDLEPQEVVGLVPTADGGVLIAANQDETGGSPQTIGTLLKQMTEPQEGRPGKEAPPRPTLQDGRLLHLEPSGVLTTLWEGKQVALLGLAADGTGATAGSYPAGRLLHAEPGRGAWIVADLPEAEASVVVGGPAGLAAVVTSNPAVLHRARPGPARGTFTTAPLDAGATARWGRATVTGAGVKALEFRGGETSEPDGSWSAWAPLSGFDGTTGTATATARYLQVRATLEGDAAELRGVSVVAEAPNRAPRLGDLVVKKPGDEGKANPVREITWKPEDPDGDRLATSVHVNRDGSPHWLEVVAEKTLDKPTVPWDTDGLPDGLYRVRITVSDAPDNVPERARQAVLVSGPLRVDNTPPRVSLAVRPAGDRILVEGEAADQTGGRIVRVRVSVDGKPWQPVAPKDGLYDGPTERFEASLPLPGPGPHDVVVQVVDADANLGAAAAVVPAR